MSKKERRFTIKQLITTGTVTSQEDLRRQLAKLGCRVTQATLSRDLADLGASWIAGSSGGRYALPAHADLQGLKPLLGAGITDIRSNENVLLVCTVPGAAATVAEFLDSQRVPDMLGTVAGDNTVLVIPSSVKRVRSLEKYIKENLIKA